MADATDDYPIPRSECWIAAHIVGNLGLRKWVTVAPAVQNGLVQIGLIQHGFSLSGLQQTLWPGCRVAYCANIREQ